MEESYTLMHLMKHRFSKAFFLFKILQKVHKSRHLNIATKKSVLRLKIFDRVQTFWLRPFVASRNFSHPAFKKATIGGC